jgi:iron complex outermembrane receptor protein
LLHLQPALRSKLLQRVRLSPGITLQDYVFRDYSKISTDFSGNRVTGVPARIYSVALDVVLQGGWYANASVLYTGRLPLDDANAAFAESYVFAAMKAGWRLSARRLVWDVFAGLDNALNQTYSLGNDLNAAGGRFYNGAPGRQFFGGVRITALKKS